MLPIKALSYLINNYLHILPLFSGGVPLQMRVGTYDMNTSDEKGKKKSGKKLGKVDNP